MRICYFILFILLASLSSALVVQPKTVSPLKTVSVMTNITKIEPVKPVSQNSMTWNVSDAKGLLSNITTDEDLEAEGWIGERSTEVNNTAKLIVAARPINPPVDGRKYYYDRNGRVLAYSFKQIVHVYSYDNLSKQKKEIIVDLQSGNITDIEGLKNALDSIDESSMGEIYSAMYALLKQSQEEKTEAMDEAKLAAEVKMNASLNAAEEKKEEIEKKTESAKKEFSGGIIERMQNFLLGRKTELANKLNGTMNETLEKSTEFGSNKGFFSKLWERIFGRKNSKD